MAVQGGGDEPFAAIAVFRDDAFLHHAAALEQASIPILDEFGKAAILLLSPGRVLPLLGDPSLARLAWFGPQGLLARLDPALEIDLLSRYGAGSEAENTPLLVRFRDVPGKAEERHVAASGFRIVTRAGPTWVVSGPVSGVPKLLSNDRIAYLEKAETGGNASREGLTKTAPVPHAETGGAAHDNATAPAPSSGGERAVPIGKRPPYRIRTPEDPR